MLSLRASFKLSQITKTTEELSYPTHFSRVTCFHPHKKSFRVGQTMLASSMGAPTKKRRKSNLDKSMFSY